MRGKVLRGNGRELELRIFTCGDRPRSSWPGGDLKCFAHQEEKKQPCRAQSPLGRLRAPPVDVRGMLLTPVRSLRSPSTPWTALLRGRHKAGWAADLTSPSTVRDSHRSEEHTSELQSLMRISYAVFCLKKKTNIM